MKNFSAHAALIAGLLCSSGAFASTEPLFPDLKVAKQAARAGDYEKAVSHWKPLADAGYTQAEVEYGKALSLGRGAESNPEKAYKYFQSAADKKDKRAYFEIGRMYEKGLGRPQNYGQAISYYKKAADMGYHRGHFMIGRIYEKQKNITLALNHYNMANLHGDKRSAQRIFELTGQEAPTPIKAIKRERKKYRFFGDVKAQYTFEENLDLGTRAADYEFSNIIDTRLGLYFYPTEDITTYLEARGFASNGQASSNTDDDDDERDLTFAELRRAWIEWDNLFNNPTLSLKIGRQRLREERSIMWNRDIDAVRLSLDTTQTRSSLSVAQNFSNYRVGNDTDFEEDEKERLRVFAELEHDVNPNHEISLRFLYEDDHSGTENIGSIVDANDRDFEDFNLLWSGIRSKGTLLEEPNNLINKITYQADALTVFGEETITSSTAGPGTNFRTVTGNTDQDVFGWGFDAQAGLQFNGSLSPTVILGYAYGSGDSNTTDGSNDSYRQTDLHGNSSRLDGLNRENQRNYGEVLRPELSNIHILNAGINLPFLQFSDINFQYFRYWLDEEQAGLRASSISAPVNGNDKYIGQEVNVSANVYIGQELKLENEYLNSSAIRFRFGIFDAGDAFGQADDEHAYRGTVEYRIRF